MSRRDIVAASRRRFMQFLAGSPLLALPGVAGFAADGPKPRSKLPDPLTWAPLDPDQLIASPKDAINVFDFEPVCRKNTPPAHFGYMASGIDDEVTLRANREGFLKFQLRPRRLNDVSKVDMSVDLLGTKFDTPIVVAPTGGNLFIHPEGEVAVARAARPGNHAQILSASANYTVEEVTAARGAPIWFQLYVSPDWNVGMALAKRARTAGCPVIAVTVDRVGGRNQETMFRLRREDARDCIECHKPGITQRALRRRNYEGIDLSNLKSWESSNLTWDFLKRLRDSTKMKILVKGIVTHEDAKLCIEHGMDGLIVSNHGARGEDNGRSTIDALPEIVEAVGGRIPVLVDSGFRRGTDIVKALAIGASAVCVGRPYLWGLGAFGQPGVERVLELLRIELRAAMQQCGVKSIREITPAFVRRAT
ncbi:MAG: alpha-hydroxy-acid oxidizing protein [Betaproteobacteria bacterium]|nr:alpha-hydroxy-acid oxidizing protein [Betaproteobacteria bacterium]